MVTAMRTEPTSTYVRYESRYWGQSRHHGMMLECRLLADTVAKVAEH
jgi:hypothetical protein